MALSYGIDPMVYASAGPLELDFLDGVLMELQRIREKQAEK